MIELRWLERGVEYYLENEGMPMRFVRVLQYRYVDLPNDRIGDWQDVPTVTP